MAGKKVTIKDVAREAGVSVATVSYVVNGRTDLRISDETRKKVLHVINLLNYSPNQTAKALASNKKSLIGFVTSKNNNYLKLAENMRSINMLSSFFHKEGYEILTIGPGAIDNYSQAAAIICMDMSKKDFQTLGNNNFIPLISLNGFIDDPLFFQINDDYENIKKLAADKFGEGYTFAILRPNNSELCERMDSSFKNICYIESMDDIKNLSGNIVTTSSVIKEIVPHNVNCLYYESLSLEKMSIVHKSIEQAIEREPIQNHDILV